MGFARRFVLFAADEPHYHRGMLIEQVIRDEAARLGFGAVGIAAVGPSTSADRFHAWLAEGCAADMRYLTRHAELRADPTRLAPGAISVIVVAARYPVNPQPGAGFSTCARGHDYHLVIRDKLRRLTAELRRHAPLKVARICVDSAPLPEREWALRAGIGWRGRQGQVISMRLGACLLLGEILVDAELPPSPPVPDHCGDCHLCVKACPTGAIRHDGTVDARKCISYLTIEHPGKIPEPLQPRLGAALFGCDCCTAVCPWNRVGDDATMPEFAAERPLPDAQACLRMTEEEFGGRFQNTSILRSGLARLKRNAAIAVVNSLPAGGPGQSPSVRASVEGCPPSG